jgi:hypothetical protein
MGKEKMMKGVPPKVGTVWRANFFRLDQPNNRPQSGTGWSPPLVGDFHALDKFGDVIFADEKGKVPGVAEDKTAPATKKAEVEKKSEGEKKAQELTGKNVHAAAKPEQ